METAPPVQGQLPLNRRRGLWSRWSASPLYLRILIAVVIGLLLGIVLSQRELVIGPESSRLWRWDDLNLPGWLSGASLLFYLNIPSKLILQLLSALAPPLILIAVVKALIETELQGASGWRLFRYLVTNTLVAILIGLSVANLLKPGELSERPAPTHTEELEKLKGDPLAQFLENIPRSVLGPLGDNGKVIGVVLLALLFGIALRKLRHDPKMHPVKDLLDVGMRTLIIVLHWIVDILPLAVLGIIANIVGTKGFADFKALAYFVVAVLLALALQATYYLLRIYFQSWARPVEVLKHMRDPLFMAFSTASSTATMPLTYETLRDKVGLREESASMGAMVGANFNNDGTALYEAMSALFIAQLVLPAPLSLTDQLIVVLMSIIASVGAAGIPEAGLVTMALVFRAVNLPIEYIPMLLAVDWFLDRCRTMINVLGDVTVSCLLDGKTPKAQPAIEPVVQPVVLPPTE
ncbi:MAG: dicarboxylate/amino acid:cation symporter [Planctomycetota bacterium]|nr:dicarboxylate/amino acid:cation symporter [Planctomycetota bacterium]